MKHIAIVGPHGAGKDSVIKELLIRFGSKYPGQFRKAIYTTTRTPRKGEIPGQDHIFTTQAKFEKMVKNGQMAFWMQMPGYLVGTEMAQLHKGNILIHNIVLFAAKKLEQTGSVLKIALNAPFEDRKRRVMEREGLNSEQALNKLLVDPRKDIQNEYHFYNLAVENPDNEFDKTVSQLENAIERFIK